MALLRLVLRDVSSRGFVSARAGGRVIGVRVASRRCFCHGGWKAASLLRGAGGGCWRSIVVPVAGRIGATLLVVAVVRADLLAVVCHAR